MDTASARVALRYASNRAVEKILKPYVGLPLECDGMTRVAAYLLRQSKIRFDAFTGTIAVDGMGELTPHFWLQLSSGDVVDYRSRMWFDENPAIPQGVFNPRGTIVSYRGRRVPLPVSDAIFFVLTMGI